MSKSRQFEPGHGYTQEDWDAVSDNPEWTARDFANAKPFAEVFPTLTATIPTRGPQKASTKKAVSIRLDPEVIDTLRAGGRGWQTRANEILRRGLRLKAKAP